MARTYRIQQIYGYLVCLIAIVTLLIATSTLINGIIDLKKPASVSPYGQYQTFAEYRTGVRRDSPKDAPVLDDSTLRRDFEEGKASREADMHWNAIKSITTSAFMIILALVLFLIHWRWLRGMERSEDVNG